MNTAATFNFTGDGPGMAIVSLGSRQLASGQSATVQADGKIVLAGYGLENSGSDFGLLRLNTNGSLDTTFNATGIQPGKALIPVGTGNDYGFSVITLPGGQLVLAGISSVSIGRDFSLVRLNANGSLDTAFNATGKALVPVGSGNDYAHSVTAQADGKLIVAGYSANGTDNDFSLVRLNTDGSLDTTFGVQGKALIAVGNGSNDQAFSVTLQPDGKIVLAGSSDGDLALVRLDTSGTLDATFGVQGKAVIPVGTSTDLGGNVALQSHGKIIIAGSGFNGLNYDFGVARLDADGTLDNSFGTGGTALVAVGNGQDFAASVAVQPDGQIVLAGTSLNANNSGEFSLARLNADGTLDISFAGDGTALFSVGASYAEGRSLALQSDGKMVLAGSQASGDVSVIRVNADGSLDTSFNPRGSGASGGTVSYTENANAVILDRTVAIFDAELAALETLDGAAGNYGGASVTLARSGGADAQDIFSARGSLSFSGSDVVLTTGAVATTVGSFTNAAGMLSVTFNASASQAVVNQVLSSIAYANSSELPPGSVQIDWLFDDGNTGAQGTGGALDASGSITVQIAPVNDRPTGAVSISGVASLGQTLSASNTLADADGLGTVSYQWQINQQNVVGATANSYTLLAGDVGKLVSVLASYQDAGGTDESVVSARSTVGNYGSTPLENTRAVTTVVPSDPLLGNSPKYTLSGADAALFKVSKTGALTFAVAPDYEVPTDANRDGAYNVNVTLTNARTGYAVTQNLVVGVAFAAIEGTSSTDKLKGTKGWDTLDGLAGDDKLTGGDGLDTFRISAGNDTVMDFNALGKAWTGPGQEVLQIAAGASATATLKSAWTATAESFNLGDGLLFTAAHEVNLSGITSGQGWDVVNKGKTTTLTGSMFGDTLTGGSGSDTLVGGAGNDKLIGSKLAGILTGGLGADTFQLGGTKGATTAHRITDFVSGEDRIALDNAVFKALRVEGGVLTEGQLAANQFVQGTAATTADQRLIYNSANGQLLYDADGSGKKAAVLVGMLDNLVPLVSTDLSVV
jgi:uncharacterized delta-60 repeat protein